MKRSLSTSTATTGPFLFMIPYSQVLKILPSTHRTPFKMHQILLPLAVLLLLNNNVNGQSSVTGPCVLNPYVPNARIKVFLVMATGDQDTIQQVDAERKLKNYSYTFKGIPPGIPLLVRGAILNNRAYAQFTPQGTPKKWMGNPHKIYF